jgi:hypothetical protein
MENGDVYEGDFFQGEKKGNGKWIFKDGSVYKGSFEKDMFNGKGSL